MSEIKNQDFSRSKTNKQDLTIPLHINGHSKGLRQLKNHPSSNNTLNIALKPVPLQSAIRWSLVGDLLDN